MPISLRRLSASRDSGRMRSAARSRLRAGRRRGRRRRSCPARPPRARVASSDGDASLFRIAGAHDLDLSALDRAPRRPYRESRGSLRAGKRRALAPARSARSPARSGARIGFPGWRPGAAASFSSSVAERDDVGDAEAALGQRAGLVEDDRVERPRPLEGRAVADQQAVAPPRAPSTPRRRAARRARARAGRR